MNGCKFSTFRNDHFLGGNRAITSQELGSITAARRGLGDTARFVLIEKFENYLVNNKISATVV
jgi:hypothetical protein